MAEHYTTLRGVYDTIGMAAFSRRALERTLDYALANDWLGQKVLDLGCGTGVATAWLAEDRFSVVGFDRSETMLEVARARSRSPQWVQADIRALGETPEAQGAELVVAFDVINEMASLNRDIAGFLGSAYQALEYNGLFVFDVHTLEGLVNRSQMGAMLVHDGDGVTMFAENDYDHETQAETRRHTTFTQDGDVWHRQDTERVLYGYRLQFLGGLLGRVGFGDIKLVDTEFSPVSTGALGLGQDRVIFIARK